MEVVATDDREYRVPALCAALATDLSPVWWNSLDMPVGARIKGTPRSAPSTFTDKSIFPTSTRKCGSNS